MFYTKKHKKLNGHCLLIPSAVEEKWGQKGCLPQSVPPFVPTQAHSGDPGQGGAV